MGINRVQFQKGLSIEEFMERYGTGEKCRVGGVAWRGVGRRVLSVRHVAARAMVPSSARDCGIGGARRAGRRPR